MDTVDDGTGAGAGSKAEAAGPDGKRGCKHERAWWRKALKAALIIGLSIVLLLSAALLAASIYLSDERVRDLLVGTLDETLLGSFEIEGVSLSLLTASVEMRGLRVRDPNGEEVIFAQSLEARLEPRSLIKNEIDIRSLHFGVSRIRLVPPPDPAGYPDPSFFTLIDAFATAGPPPDPDEPDGAEWTVRITSLALTDLGLHLSTGEGVEIDIDEGVIEQGSFSYDPDGIKVSLGGDLGRLLVRVDDTSLDLAAVRMDGIRLTYGPGKGGSVELGTIDARYGRKEPEDRSSIERNISLSGSVSGLGEEMETEEIGLSIDVGGVVDLETGAIRSFLPEDLAASLDPKGLVEISAGLRGTISDYRVEGSFSSSALAAFSERFVRIESRFGWHEGVLDLEALEAALADGGIEGNLRVDLGEDEELGWSGTLRASELPLERLASSWSRAMGGEDDESEGSLLPKRLSGTIETRGSYGEAVVGMATVDILVKGIPEDILDGLPSDLRFRGTARFDQRWLRLEPMRATGSGLDARVSGRVPIADGGAMDLFLMLSHGRPNDFFLAYDLPLGARSLNLSARISGSFNRPIAEGVLDLAGATIEGVPRLELELPFRFDGGRIHLNDARVGIAGGEVVARGFIDVTTPDLEVLDDFRLSMGVRVSGLRLAELTDDLARGSVSARGRVEGSLSNLRGEAEVEIEGLAAYGVEFASATTEVGIDSDWVMAEKLVMLPLEGGRIEGRGRIHLSEMQIEADLSARDLPLSLAGAFTEEPLPLFGQVDLDAQVRGSVEEPRLSATIAAGGLRYDEMILGSLDADIEGDLSRLGLRVGLSHLAGRLDATGWVSIEDESLEVSLSGQRLVIDSLPYIAEMEQKISGRLLVDLNLGGTFSSPELSGKLLARTVELDGERFGDGRIAVDVRPLGQMVHELSVSLFGASTLGVELRLDPVLSVSAEGGLDALSLAWLMPSLVEYDLDAVLTGRVSADYVSDGEVTARVDLDSLSVKVGDERLTSRSPMSVSWSEDGLLLEGLSLQGPNGTFEAFGSVGESIDLVARGTLEMELLSPFISDFALATGTIDLDMRVKGETDAPIVTGDIGILRPVKLRPRRMIREIEISTGRARFEPGRLVLERLSGSVHSGIFRASGELELEGLSPKSYGFTFSGQSLPLRTTDLLLEANADLTFTGGEGRSKVGGRIEVVRGRYMEKFELDRFAFRRTRRVVDEPLSQRMPFLNDIDLDMRVMSLGAMEIRADAGAFALDMVLDADLKVTGTAADPILDGRVEANRGGLQFPRARLDVARSNIEFIPRPGEAIRPRIDLRAEGEVTPTGSGEMGQTTYFVTLILDGDLEEMILDLTSDPALDRLEILSLLVTGRRPAAHLAGASGSQADAAMVFAGSQLAEPLTRFVTQQLESYLNLDLDLSAEVTSAGLTLVAGKEVTRRLRFEYAFQRGFVGDSAASQAARARYLISDRIFLEGTTESVMGQGAASAGAREGARSRLELKLRFYGN